MRPTDKTRNQDLARSQGDHSTLYVSLELSRSSWLVTSLSPNSDKMSKHSIAASGYDPPFTHLERFKGKIVATVGTAFDQTHPDGLEFFRTLKADLRIFKDDAVLFHPEVYLFSSASRVAIFVGSSNLTFSDCCSTRVGLQPRLGKGGGQSEAMDLADPRHTAVFGYCRR